MLTFIRSERIAKNYFVMVRWTIVASIAACSIVYGFQLWARPTPFGEMSVWIVRLLNVAAPISATLFAAELAREWTDSYRVRVVAGSACVAGVVCEACSLHMRATGIRTSVGGNIALLMTFLFLGLWIGLFRIKAPDDTPAGDTI